MEKQISRCRELNMVIRRDVNYLENVLEIQMPFENGEMCAWHMRVGDEFDHNQLRFRLPENIYLLHVKGSDDEDSTGT